MRNYLATLDSSVFVLDYDHNAPTLEHLQETYYPLYETIRSAHPKTPIVIISRPNFYHDPSVSATRRDYIKSVYKRAKKTGDKKVWFIDGATLFGKKDYDLCTVDLCHPNDLGMYRIAKTIAPVLKKALKKSK